MASRNPRNKEDHDSIRVVEQLDLFAATGAASTPPVASSQQAARLIPGDLDDAALVVGISAASHVDCLALVAEVGRRRLAAAVPVLETLCRRFKGFGLNYTVPEQIAALTALVAVGGSDAAAAVSRMISATVILGPGLAKAVNVAAELKAHLPYEILSGLLRQAEPAIRADACRCVRSQRQVIPLLLDLLNDLNDQVANEAACVLGRMGQIQARPRLLRLLHENPMPAWIDAIVGIADEDSIVALGRIVRTRADLTAVVVDALDKIDHPKSTAILKRIVRS